MKKNNFGCRVSCTGLFADVSFKKGNPNDATEDDAVILDSEVFSDLMKDYQIYKRKSVRNMMFNSTSPTLGM